ncbi:hypothetical protein, partial [Novosphingobium sp.]|uniref:hypothetical protein n=1 Tax=Novosphingobium sp. TaxID=1874826 RepID=UPI0035B0F98F
MSSRPYAASIRADVRAAKRAGRSCKMEAVHPARLCRWRSTNIKPVDSRYDRGTSGGQVTLTIVIGFAARNAL